MDRMDTLTAVLRGRLETGEHGDCHVNVTPAGWAALRAEQQAADRSAFAFEIDRAVWLRGIPVVVDSELTGDGRWQLVRTGTGEIVIDSAAP